MAKKTVIPTPGICSFEESPHCGKPCQCFECIRDPKLSDDCDCYLSEGVIYDCEGPVEDCQPDQD